MRQAVKVSLCLFLSLFLIQGTTRSRTQEPIGVPSCSSPSTPPADPTLVGRKSCAIHGSITVKGHHRTYLLYVPASLPTNQPLPLVLAFHGSGGNGEGMERLVRFQPVADREGFLVLYPDGIGNRWNDGRSAYTPQENWEEIDDIAFVNALIDTIAREYPVDPNRIYATGFSSGGMLSFYLAVQPNSRLAAIAPVAGGMFDPNHTRFQPDHPISVLILQNVQDPAVPYRGARLGGRIGGRMISTDETAQRWVEQNGCNPEPIVEPLPDRDLEDGCTAVRLRWTGCRQGTAVTLYRLTGSGHTWAGGNQYLPEQIVGKVCRDVSATEEMWTFFKQHPRLK